MIRVTEPEKRFISETGFPLSHVKTLIISKEEIYELNNREMFHSVKDVRPSSWAIRSER